MVFIHCLLLLTACGPRKNVADIYKAHVSDDEVLTLHFAWPRSFSADVQIESHELLQQGDEVHEHGSLQAVRMQVTPEGEHHLVDWVDFRFIEAIKGGEPSDMQMLTVVWETTPQLVLSASGELVDCRGREIPPPVMEEALSKLGEELDQQQRAQIEGTLRNLATGAAREQATIAEWYQGLGFWVGKELESSVVYEVETGPAASYVDMMLMEEFEWEGWTACVPGGDDEACVRLARHRHPRDENVKTRIEAALRMKAASDGYEDPEKLRLLDFVTEWEQVLIVDPETLLPWSLSTASIGRQRVRMPDGTVKDERVESSETRTYRYLE